jgi:hypothetical protein
MQWLQSNRMMVIGDYHRAFCAAFYRIDVTSAHLHGLRKRKGWLVGRAPGRFAGRHRLFSGAEIEWLQNNCTKALGDFHRDFCAKFSRKDVSAAQIRSLHKNEGWKTGRTGRFETGSVPANKGKPAPYHPNSARTRFKKGQLPHNTKYAGHERVATHGYIEISVDETNPNTGFERRYVLKHRWLFEQKHGPIPEGMVLKCTGDNHLNTDPSNWELVPRALLPRLNGRFGRGYDSAPGDLKPTIMAVAKLEHALNEKNQR